MTHRTKSRILSLAVPAVALGGWLLLPSGFPRGVLVGVAGTVAVAVGAVMVYTRRLRKKIGAHLQPPPLPVSAFDYAWTVQDLAGATVPMSRYAGRVLVLHLWATWCGPCLTELPSLQRLQAATADLDVGLVCLSPEKAEQVSAFVKKHGLALPTLLFEGAAPPCFGGRAIPATFVLDRAGTIVMRHVGAARWDDASVVTYIRGLAAAPA